MKSATPPSAQWGCARFPSRNRPTSEFSRSSPRSLHTSHQAQGTKHKALLYAANGGAVSADITSANTVGYITAQVSKANYKTFSVNLTDVGSPDAGVKINKLFTIDNITSAPTWGGTMDQIWRWDTKNNKWAKYGYQKPARSGTAAWRKYNYDSDKSFSELTDDDVVMPGETFMYMRGGGTTATLTLAGQVREFGYVGGYTISKANYQFIAYPWPVSFKISEIGKLATFSKITAVPGWGGTMDQIWRWDTKVNQWAKYGYQKPARSGTAAWRKYNYDTDNSFSELTDDDKIAAGEGFLYMRGGGETLTLTWKALESAE